MDVDTSVTSSSDKARTIWRVPVVFLSQHVVGLSLGVIPFSFILPKAPFPTLPVMLGLLWVAAGNHKITNSGVFSNY